MSGKQREWSRIGVNGSRDVIIHIGGNNIRKKGGTFEGQLVGIMCSHVDDFFYRDMETFLRKVIGQLMGTLEVGSTETK